MKKTLLKDALLVFMAVALTGSTVFVMEPQQKEFHTNSQSVSLAQEPEPKTEVTPDPTPVETPVAADPVVEQPVEPAPVSTPAPQTVKTRVDSTIPARIFCGSPAQRTWKTPLLENATMGREMAAAKGWTGGQWDALYELWSCESSWNNFAQNASSAFGIAQFLDSTWGLPGLAYANCSKTVDAREQIRCGLEYIQVVYGTPAVALAKHYRDNSY